MSIVKNGLQPLLQSVNNLDLGNRGVAVSLHALTKGVQSILNKERSAQCRRQTGDIATESAKPQKTSGLGRGQGSAAQPECKQRSGCYMGFHTGFQTTIAEAITISGIGVHSNAPASINLYPADPDSGVRFLRAATSAFPETEIPASWEHVSATELCTVLGRMDAAYVSTVEHLMAALRGLNIDNVLVEIDGPETPIMDGSSAAFVDAIDSVGTITHAKRRKAIRVLKPIRVENGDCFGELRPYDGTRFDVTIDFPCDVIGRQTSSFDLTPDVFRTEIARARTFGFLKDVEKLNAMNLAFGSSLENTVVLDDTPRVMNPGGLRWADEFVRHKALDAIGDLALAGAPIVGHYSSYKGGHRLNFAMLEALFADSDAWEYVDGSSVDQPVGHVAAPAAVAAPVYSPDV